MKKRFSIGSKKENAKQVDINLNPKHIKFGTVIFVLALLFHMFVWSPYLEKEYKMDCGDGEIVTIEDGMTEVCGIAVPPNMKSEDISKYLVQQIQSQDNYGGLMLE